MKTCEFVLFWAPILRTVAAKTVGLESGLGHSSGLCFPIFDQVEFRGATGFLNWGVTAIFDRESEVFIV